MPKEIMLTTSQKKRKVSKDTSPANQTTKQWFRSWLFYLLCIHILYVYIDAYTVYIYLAINIFTHVFIFLCTVYMSTLILEDSLIFVTSSFFDGVQGRRFKVDIVFMLEPDGRSKIDQPLASRSRLKWKFNIFQIEPTELINQGAYPQGPQQCEKTDLQMVDSTPWLVGNQSSFIWKSRKSKLQFLDSNCTNFHHKKALAALQEPDVKLHPALIISLENGGPSPLFHSWSHCVKFVIGKSFLLCAKDWDNQWFMCGC